MPTIAAFLLSITGSIAKRVLVALGLGFVSYTAFSSLTDQLIGYAYAQYQSIPGIVLQILNMGGVGQAFGIISSAMVTRASLMAIKRLRPL